MIITAFFKLPEGKVCSRETEMELHLQARELLISSRATHLDQLTDKLREERVHQVIANLLAGEGVAVNVQIDDLQYVEDMGLITLDKQIRL